MDNFLFTGNIINKKEYILEAIQILDDLNIPISRSVEFKYGESLYNNGSCIRLKHWITDYRVTVNRHLTNHYFINTVIHELLHTIKFEDNHDGEWAKYAEIVSNNTKFKIAISNRSSYVENDDKFKTMSKEEIHNYYLECKKRGDLDELLKEQPTFKVYLSDEDMINYLLILIDKIDWNNFKQELIIKDYYPKGFKRALYKRCKSGYYNDRIKNFGDYVFITGFFSLTKMYNQITEYYSDILVKEIFK